MRNKLQPVIELLEKIMFWIGVSLAIINIIVVIYLVFQPQVYMIHIPMLYELKNEQEQKDMFMRGCVNTQYCECSYNFTRTFYNIPAIYRQNKLYEKTGDLPQYLIEAHQFCHKYY